MSNRPRVAHVISTPSGVGGAERVLQSLVHGTLDSGRAVHVFNPFAREPDSGALRESLPEGTYTGLRCTTLRSVPSLRRALLRGIAAFNPDIVHAHLFHASTMTATFPTSVHVARLLTHHQGDVFAIDNAFRREAVDRIVTRRYDRVVAVSRAAADFLISRYRVPQDRLEVIRNGWSGNPRSRTARIETPTVVCTANLRVEKGHLDLLAAFELLVARIPSARLLLLGTGPLRSEIERQIAAHGLQDAVTMCGHVDDVWPYLADSHIFASPSHSESFGIAVLEAMAAGLPVVATDVGGLPEIVEPGVTGELFSQGDVATLARLLEALLSDYERARYLGANGASRAQRLTTEVMVARYLALYEELFEEHAAQASLSPYRRR